METAVRERTRVCRLSLGDQVRAVVWLQARSEEAARRPQTEMAAALAEHLGRPVTTGNLGTIAEAAGVRLRGIAVGAAGESVLALRILDVRDRVEVVAEELGGRIGEMQRRAVALESSLAALASRINDIADRYGPL